CIPGHGSRPYRFDYPSQAAKVCWFRSRRDGLFGREVFLIPRRRRFSMRPQIGSSLRTWITGILLLVAIASATTLLVDAQSRAAARAGQTPAAGAHVRYVPD